MQHVAHMHEVSHKRNMIILIIEIIVVIDNISLLTIWNIISHIWMVRMRHVVHMNAVMMWYAAHMNHVRRGCGIRVWVRHAYVCATRRNRVRQDDRFVRMKHCVTHMNDANESCRTCAWCAPWRMYTGVRRNAIMSVKMIDSYGWNVRSRIWMMRMSHVTFVYVTRMNDDYDNNNYDCRYWQHVVLDNLKRHVTHMDESCHTYEWCVTQMNDDNDNNRYYCHYRQYVVIDNKLSSMHYCCYGQYIFDIIDNISLSFLTMYYRRFWQWIIVVIDNISLSLLTIYYSRYWQCIIVVNWQCISVVIDNI